MLRPYKPGICGHFEDIWSVLAAILDFYAKTVIKSHLLTPSENVLEHFKPLSAKEVEDIIKKYPKTSCELDPIPSKLLVKILPSVLPTITDI